MIDQNQLSETAKNAVLSYIEKSEVKDENELLHSIDELIGYAAIALTIKCGHEPVADRLQALIDFIKKDSIRLQTILSTKIQ